MPNTSESDRSKSEFLREEGTLNPGSPAGARCKVSRKRVLRSPRSGAGEIRDAAPCFHRERGSSPGRPGLRSLTADLLPGQGQLGACRDRGPRAQEARPPRPAQTPGRRARVSEAATRFRPAVTGSAIVETAWAGVPPQGPSEDDRASAAWKKNCPMIRGDTESSSVASSSLRVQYECLRLAALGEPLPPQARSGLLLFLRRGMWGWARGLSVTPTALPQSSQAPSSDRAAACGERQAAIQLLAQMAVNGLKRRSS